MLSAVKTVEFVSDRISYMVLGGLWRNVNILNANARTEEKCDGSNGSFMQN
jgi:hypothetical protein